MVVNGGYEVSVSVVRGKEYRNEKVYPSLYLKRDAVTGEPTCYGEFSDGGEFRLAAGFYGEILAVVL